LINWRFQKSQRSNSWSDSFINVAESSRNPSPTMYYVDSFAMSTTPNVVGRQVTIQTASINNDSSGKLDHFLNFILIPRKGPFKWYVTIFSTFLTLPNPLCHHTFLRLVCLEMWNWQVGKYLLKQQLGVKQDFLLPNASKAMFKKAKNLETHCRTHLKVSHIIWMAPDIYKMA